MEQKEIIEGNKLIGLFDGWYQKDLPKNGDINWFHETYSTRLTNKTWLPSKPDNFKYHTSFDWLIPVVEKIESLWINGAQPRCKIERTYVEIVHEVGYHNVDFASNSLIKKDNQIGGASYSEGTKIENLYKMVIRFITWFNSISIEN